MKAFILSSLLIVSLGFSLFTLQRRPHPNSEFVPADAPVTSEVLKQQPLDLDKADPVGSRFLQVNQLLSELEHWSRIVDQNSKDLTEAIKKKNPMVIRQSLVRFRDSIDILINGSEKFEASIFSLQDLVGTTGIDPEAFAVWKAQLEKRYVAIKVVMPSDADLQEAQRILNGKPSKSIPNKKDSVI